MKVSTIFLFLMMYVSCMSPTTHQSLYGSYSAKGKDYNYSLTLHPDSTFLLTIKSYGLSPSCSGKWMYLSNDTLDLSCFEVSYVEEYLSSGYMKERNPKVEIIHKNKLKFGEVILKKVK